MNNNENNPFNPVSSQATQSTGTNPTPAAPQATQPTTNVEPNENTIKSSFASNFTAEHDADNEEFRETKSSTLNISWSASEALDHARGSKWKLAYIAGGAAILALLAGLVLIEFMSLLSAIITGTMVVLMIIAIFVVANKPIREINYNLNESGIEIDNILHPFSEFRSFGVRQSGAMWELVLIPTKRFGMSITMFIHEDQGEQIVDELSDRLPMEEISASTVDKISQIMKL